MKLQFGLMLASAALLFTTHAGAADITGAGATFPYPVYAKWADAYKKVTGIRLNYQSIGSGGGIKQIKAKTVDFGASDKPLTVEELEKNGLTQFPTVIGGVVPVINVEGMQAGQIKLTGAVLADIFLPCAVGIAHGEKGEPGSGYCLQEKGERVDSFTGH